MASQKETDTADKSFSTILKHSMNSSFGFTRRKKNQDAQSATKKDRLVTMPVDFSWPISAEDAEFAQSYPFNLTEYFLTSVIFMNLKDHRCTPQIQLAPPCALVIMRINTICFEKRICFP